MLPTFIIGLREGLEASLIIGIIAAFLIQRGDRKALRPMWYGVALALALCLGVAAILEAVDRSLPHKQQEGLETVLALVAVVGVTYMVVWMKRHSRELKGSLERSAESALVLGSAWALIGMAFFAVLREGLETAVFLLAVFGNSTNPAATGTGAVLGIAVAVGLGFAIYKGGVRINLSRFFRFTGFVLVLVAAGLLSSAVHTAHEAGWTARPPGAGVRPPMAGRARVRPCRAADRHARPPADTHRRRDDGVAPLCDPDEPVRPVAGSATRTDRAKLRAGRGDIVNRSDPTRRYRRSARDRCDLMWRFRVGKRGGR